MRIVIALLKTLGLYREPTIDSITSPIGKIVDRLNAFAAEQNTLADSNRIAATNLLTQAHTASAAATHAFALADRYADLTLKNISAA